MNKGELRELFADLAHKQWSGWMEYLFSKCDTNFTLPQWAVERWQRQMKTEYANLSEEEKNSDRDEADKMIIIAEQYAKSKISILLTETIEPLQSEISRLKGENEAFKGITPSSRIWTDSDIDAAYIMGAINADLVKADEGEVFPSLSKVNKELERLKGLGFDRPYKALIIIRYPNDLTT